nr:ribonuclease H-like domain-containing protein [Tanacetum cinerariifolium]
ESLDQIYDRLQKLISQLEILGESLSQKDINLKFLRSLPTEWRNHTLIWRNKTDLEDQSLDDQFNSLKIYEAEVKSSSTTSTATQNITFMSSQKLTALVNQLQKLISQLEILGESLSQKDINLKFLRSLPTEWRNHTLIWRNKTDLEDQSLDDQFNSLKIYEAESFQAEEEPTNYALMAFTYSSFSSSDNEKTGIEYVETRILVYQQNETVFEEDIKLLKLDVQLRDNALVELRKKFEEAKQERDELKLKLENFQTSSKNLIYDRYKSGEGYHAVPPPYTRTFMPPKPDLVFHDASTINETVSTAFNVSDSEDEYDGKPMHPQKEPSFVQTTKHVKTPRPSVKTVEHPISADHLRKDFTKSRGHSKSKNRMSCFVCKSLTHLIKDFLTRSRIVPLSAARTVNNVVPQTKVQHQRPPTHGVNKAPSPERRPINRRPSPQASKFHHRVTAVKAPRDNDVKGVQGNW